MVWGEGGEGGAEACRGEGGAGVLCEVLIAEGEANTLYPKGGDVGEALLDNLRAAFGKEREQQHGAAALSPRLSTPAALISLGDLEGDVGDLLAELHTYQAKDLLDARDAAFCSVVQRPDDLVGNKACTVCLALGGDGDL